MGENNATDKSYDFMLEEYKQIFGLYRDLYQQKNDLLKFYVTIIGAGASVVTILTKITENNQNILSVKSLPIDPLITIGFLAILLSFVGLIIFLSMMGLRIEMILYIRTINVLRGFFAEKDKKDNPEDKELLIKEFLVLPDYDENTPPFRESWVTSFFWVTLFIALINSVLLVVGVYLLTMTAIWPLVIVWILFHYILYYAMTSHMRKKYREKRKKPRRKKDLGNYMRI